jgi:hypothetical protein
MSGNKELDGRRFSWDDRGELIVHTPVVFYECELGKLACNWLNTTLHSHFDHQFDHIDHYSEAGIAYKLPAEDHMELIRQLIDLDFEATHHPIPDRQTIAWYIELATRAELEAEGIG